MKTTKIYQVAMIRNGQIENVTCLTKSLNRAQHALVNTVQRCNEDLGLSVLESLTAGEWIDNVCVQSNEFDGTMFVQLFGWEIVTE